jgi:hypothetical protein
MLASGLVDLFHVKKDKVLSVPICFAITSTAMFFQPYYNNIS